MFGLNILFFVVLLIAKHFVDKDIIKKNNKVYSPETCCLVPQNVNSLFIRGNAIRGNLPIGVIKHRSKYQAHSSVKVGKKTKHVCLGTYNTPEEAFYTYKKVKEKYIKQVAKEEFSQRNITKECYNAMMNYEVEITD